MGFNDSETVGSEEAFWADALFSKQKKHTQNMRSALLSCSDDDPFSVRNTFNRILVLRVYHQITRIIRYTEEMDKIEKKLYQVIDATLDKMDPEYVDENTSACLASLLALQKNLQQSMIDSQKLLDPYLGPNSLNYVDVQVDPSEKNNDPIAGEVLDSSSRRRLREGAREALAAIQSTYNGEEA